LNDVGNKEKRIPLIWKKKRVSGIKRIDVGALKWHTVGHELVVMGKLSDRNSTIRKNGEKGEQRKGGGRLRGIEVSREPEMM